MIDLNYERSFNEIRNIGLHAPAIQFTTPLDLPSIIARNWIQQRYYAQFLSKVGTIIVSTFIVNSVPPILVRIYRWGPEIFAEWEAVHESGLFTHLGKSWSNGVGDSLGGGSVSINPRRLGELMMYPEVNEIRRLTSLVSGLSLEQLVRLSYDFVLKREKPTGSVRIAPEEAFADVVKNTFCSNLLRGVAVGLFSQIPLIELPEGTVYISDLENLLEGSSEPYVSCLKIGPSNNVLTYHAVCFLNVTGYRSTTAALAYLLSTHLLQVTIEMRRSVRRYFGALSCFEQCSRDYQQGNHGKLTEEQLWALQKLERLEAERKKLLIAIENTKRSVDSLVRDGVVRRIGREIIALGNVVQTASTTLSFDPRVLQAYYWEKMRNMHEVHNLTFQLRARRTQLSAIDHVDANAKVIDDSSGKEEHQQEWDSGISDLSLAKDKGIITFSADELSIHAGGRGNCVSREETILEEKRSGDEFDVFLCYNSDDKAAIKLVGGFLRTVGLLPWLDEWELRPGTSWQQCLEKQIKRIRSAAVFVGPRGIGPWQDLEHQALLRQFVQRRCPVIPVILPGCSNRPKLPVFLEGMTWVDFRKTDPNPLEQLMWGITGRRPSLDALANSRLTALSERLLPELQRAH